MGETYPVSKILSAVLNSITLEIYEGNIFDIEADILVNPANDRLENSGGLAKIVRDLAGDEYEEECRNYCATKGSIKPGYVALTKSGKLSAYYSGIIQAVGPIGNASRESSNILVSTLVNSFKLADEHKLATIISPGISTGIYGYPNEEAAKCHIAAFIIFAGQIAAIRQTNLKCIKYALINPEVSKCFANEAMKKNNVFQVFQYYGLQVERGMSILNSLCAACKQSYEIKDFELSSNCCKQLCKYCVYSFRMQKCSVCQGALLCYEQHPFYNHSLCRYCSNFYSKGSSCKCRGQQKTQVKF
ncbi:hypothetical protein SteCoe_32648 [Stentor coeruleus]|uniref:Macro domain-containing protein n=1 Tax=Stentor coeruleus TaxID=5963 RepID=A0A1R2AYH6_9CILI|nr:hypothetical protein SteCoe_32648 [Stentor coeruleus]